MVVWFTGGGDSGAMLRSIKLVRAVRLVRLFKIGRIIQKSGFFDKVTTRADAQYCIRRCTLTASTVQPW